MSDQPEEKQKVSEEIEIPPSLLEEARMDLAKTAKDYQILTLQIHRGELELKQKRQEKAELLRKNPWLGNIQGVINKEATKAAKKSLIPPEDHVAEQPEASSGKEEVERIPKKRSQAAINQAGPSKRTRLEKKIRQVEDSKKPSQFLPGHPSYGK